MAGRLISKRAIATAAVATGLVAASVALLAQPGTDSSP